VMQSENRPKALNGTVRPDYPPRSLEDAKLKRFQTCSGTPRSFGLRLGFLEPMLSFLLVPRVSMHTLKYLYADA